MTSLPIDVRQLSDRASIPKTVVALGCFDGVHLGHRAIISAAATLARRLGAALCVFSFTAPPASYSSNGARILLSDTEERLALFRELGADIAAFADFPTFKDVTAEDFIRCVLIDQCHAVGSVCGFNFRFGKGRGGSPELLSQCFGENALSIDAVMHEGTPISSSRIRSLISDGDIESAALMLGRCYSVALPILKGRGDGKKLGFPTVNQYPPEDRVIPSFGVYATRTTLQDGSTVASVSDVGIAPTIDKSGVPRIETHLIDTCAELYGETVQVEFVKRLRGEMKFPSLDELIKQVNCDIDTARELLAQKI